MEVDRSRESDQRSEDREHRESQRYDHDDNTPTTFERAEPVLQKMMGDDYGKYFDTTAQEVAEDEVQADYERESKLGAI